MTRDFSTSRAVLVGNATFPEDPHLGDVPASSCVTAMSELLTSDLCGWPVDRVKPVLDAPTRSALSMDILRASRDVQGVLLVYYVGHGLRMRDGQLALAVRDTVTDSEALPHTALPYQGLADILQGSPATTKLVILDCCYAELANKARDGLQSAGLADAYPVDGLYCIFAAQTHQKAKFPIGGQLTYFTEAFVDTIRSGIPGQPAELRLDQIFAEVRRRLSLAQLPRPADSGIRDARQYPFARNAFYRTATLSIPDPAREERLRILGEAEQAAAAITSWGSSDHKAPYRRAIALLQVSAELAADDPDRGRELARRAMHGVASTDLDPHEETALALAMSALDPARAERIAGAITDPRRQAGALAQVAGAIAAIDPARAQRIAQGIADPGERDAGLASVVSAVSGTDSALAEEVASLIGDPASRAKALADIATAIAAADLDHARQIAATISAIGQSQALRPVVEALAMVDLDTAVFLADAITDQRRRDSALDRIIMAIGENDPEGALRVSEMISDQRKRDSAQSYLAWEIASRNPGLAEQISATITDPGEKFYALVHTACVMARSDSEDARRLLGDLERVARAVSDQERRSSLVKSYAREIATVNAVLGERMANSLTETDDRALALVAVAEAVASTDIAQAGRIAHSIKDEYWQPYALVKVAGIGMRSRPAPMGARRLLLDAEKIAGALTDAAKRAKITAAIAAATAEDDPRRAMTLADQAETIARTITSDWGNSRDRLLREIAIQLMRGPIRGKQVLDRHAERIARDIPHPKEQAAALQQIAREVFAYDPGRAERVASAINWPEDRVQALIMIAQMHASATLFP
jgi:hypothetical protein